MPETLEAISADAFIQEEYPQTFRANGQTALTQAEEAKRVLGFDLDKTDQATPEIVAAFQEHGLYLYRPEEVEIYKDQRVRQARREAKKPMLYWGVVKGLGIALLLLATAALSGIIIASMFPSVHISTATWLASIASFVCSCIFACWSFFRWEDHEMKYGRVEIEWQDFSLKKFPDQIPAAVITQTLEIKRCIPNATFTVSKLVRTTKVEERVVLEPQMPLFDPILYVRSGKKHFSLPVAVWEEPEFNGVPVLASSLD